jgi:Helitron helicase-like domain at N-terminus/PIF1-like helicase
MPCNRILHMLKSIITHKSVSGRCDKACVHIRNEMHVFEVSHALAGVTACETNGVATKSRVPCDCTAQQGFILLEQYHSINASSEVYDILCETMIDVSGVKIILDETTRCIRLTFYTCEVAVVLDLLELPYREYTGKCQGINSRVRREIFVLYVQGNHIRLYKNVQIQVINTTYQITVVHVSYNGEEYASNLWQYHTCQIDYEKICEFIPQSNARLCDLFVVYTTTILAIGYISINILLNTLVRRLSKKITHGKSCIGGGSSVYLFHELKGCFVGNQPHNTSGRFRYERYIHGDTYINVNEHEGVYACKIPLSHLSTKLTIAELRHVAACHGIFTTSKMRISYIRSLLEDHSCKTCAPYIAMFIMIDDSKIIRRARIKNLTAVIKYQHKKYDKYKLLELSPMLRRFHSNKDIHKLAELAIARNILRERTIPFKPSTIILAKKKNVRHVQSYEDLCTESPQICQINHENSTFPPQPAGFRLIHTIITNACDDVKDANISEKGCAICGCLTLISELTLLEKAEVDLNMLIRMGVTRKERTSMDQPVEEIDGPIIDNGLDSICTSCHKSMSNKKIPLMALVNGNWLGEIPNQLRNLSFAEHLLISRVRHNCCVVRVSSGMRKMRANAISFANPTPKIYNILPPPKKELEEVLAIIYTGPCKPTEKDFQRTPLLVRRNKVKMALEWLKLNNCEYEDLEISHENLKQYPDNDIPVIVDYRHSDMNKEPEATAVNDMNEEEGTEQGMCSFVVHGLTGDEYSRLSVQALKTIALKHLAGNKNVLAIGHASTPESIYDNPQLFPKMMPWLFPYGFGGVGNKMQRGRISDITHKRHLLLYHDKRFQMDPHFPLIAFNHEQIKQCTSAGYLLAAKAKFANISERILNVNISTVESLAKRMEQGERIVPDTADEKLCFQLIKDLDHVGAHVKGSMTSKKFMRNELWSLISFMGAPSWFITFAPADNKHPICLYFADTQETFNPDQMRDHDTRYRLIANNPVAGARFFHFMCNQFIKHVLGVGEEHRGIYGDTTAYYGTVEQQGRLTLHLHLLLWINASVSPQEIRNRIMDPSSDFQQKMIKYLESVHVGEFLTGSMTDIETRIRESARDDNYRNPTETLPERPPPLCNVHDNDDSPCICLEEWYHRYKDTVDDLILKSNVHTCRKPVYNSKGSSANQRPTCFNKHNNCKARFPRKKYKETTVDLKTGALNMKKLEEWINTITPALTYIIRCNSDVTSLLSGTAIKAVVAYVSDYITKNGLNTYSIFEAIRRILERNSELIGGDTEQKEKARRLIIKIVNTLTSKMEIGGPMASLYLLGNPDHYTSHKFITIYWRNFVWEALKPWKTPGSIETDDVVEKLVLLKSKNAFIGLSSVHDYIFRPLQNENISLYEWSQMAKRAKQKQEKDKKKKKETGENTRYIKAFYAPTSDNIIECDPNGMYNKDMINFEDDTQKQMTDIEDIEESLVDTNSDVDNGNTISFKNGEHDKDQTGRGRIQINHFHKDHPLYLSHVAHFDPNRADVVLNFVGGSLPRRDRGDREYYCATMLTLFKPWRNGKDLKSEVLSWHETFISHNFTTRQNEIMDNFNLRYECNDARDDYSAQLKMNNSSEAKLPVWMTTEEFGDEDTNDFKTTGQLDQSEDDDIDEEEEEKINKYADISERGQVLQAQMISAANSVISAGWLDNSPDGLHSISTIPVQPTTEMQGNKWKVVIQEKREEIVNLRYSKMLKASTETIKDETCFNDNNVRVVNQSYLDRSFKCESNTVRLIMDETIELFKLNTEQERAFRIVGNHASNNDHEQLKMYIGGMAGTGKSQVIKALNRYFDQRCESHRFLILGPTGTSAALLGGSTYHSVLGIHLGENRNEGRTIMQVKTKLEGVDYIFIDEVSMVSCQQLYKISAQLAKALGEHQRPFGGMNMIFAGDFAQLPPVGGSSLYSGDVGTRIDSSTHISGQQAAIGKALWHQVTTVVILRENMRQKSQTKEDVYLRKALSNMRYGACTAEDINFMNTRIAGKRPDQPKVASKDFRNIAIICGLNTQKDMINQLGCERFATDTNQTLTHFYSVDRWAKDRRDNKSKRSNSNVHNSGEIDLDDQREIWKLHPGRTGHLPGKLSLCLGIPVIIKHNYATELCMTNGQEGTVVGWRAEQGTHGILTLDTLFVKLDNPPQPVKLDGLPENVVPIVKVTQTIICQFLNDLTESVERQQVWVQLNFAMTAHAAQGKTRPHNTVHLNSCRDHMAYYTALSRSASAKGTIIIQGFDKNIITKRCSGHLRQEFREQEILDDITALRYEGNLPSNISENLRNPLLRQYQSWKGLGYAPEKTDYVLKWSSDKPMSLVEEVIDSEWKLVTKIKDQKISTKVSAGNCSPLTLASKRKSDDPMTSITKRIKTAHSNTVIELIDIQPIGLIWDQINYSCAYDSLIVIIHHIWIKRPATWTDRLLEINTDYLRILVDGFVRVRQIKSNLESVRDQIRNLLHTRHPRLFPVGHIGASVGDLTDYIFGQSQFSSCVQSVCSQCSYKSAESRLPIAFVNPIQAGYTGSASDWMTRRIHRTRHCPQCGEQLIRIRSYVNIPNILVFEHVNEYDLDVQRCIQLTVAGQRTDMFLRGLVYFGGYHFTSRVISLEGDVWYNDGMITGRRCIREGKFDTITNENMRNYRGRRLKYSIYARQ